MDYTDPKNSGDTLGLISQARRKISGKSTNVTNTNVHQNAAGTGESDEKNPVDS